MSIASELERIRTAKSAIRSAVNAKGGNLAENQLLDDYAAAITALPEGGNIDLGFITAGADQILERFTGADKNGNPVYGNIKVVTPVREDNIVTVDKGYVDRQFLLTVPEAPPSLTMGNVVTTHAGYHPKNEEIIVGTEQGATAITPGTSNQTAAEAGTYLTGPITVLGDADLIAENIAEGKEIFGVAGSFKGGSSMEFYKCAAVHGPVTINVVRVEGAGTTKANGDYVDSGEVNDGIPVYTNGTCELYGTSYGMYAITDIPDYRGEAEALYTSDRLNGGTWYCNGEGIAPAPTVSEIKVTLDEDVPKTWDGYKAVFDGQYYSFTETITTGLTYGTAFVPVKGRVYDSACTIKLAGVWTNIPQEGLIFYDPLNGDNPNVPEIGGEYNISNNPPSYKEIDGIACADFSTGQRLAISGITGFPANDVTLSCWAKQKDSGMYLILFGYGHDSSFEVCMLRGDGGNGKFGIERGSGQVYADVNLKDGKWHHLAATIGADGNNAIWVDGLMVHQFNQQFRIANGTLSIGTWLSGSSGSNVYMASARIYNRVLTSDEIGNLAGEFFAGGNTAPVFYTPLSEAKTTAETGQALTVSGNPVYGTVDSVPCITFDGSSHMSFPDAGLPAGTSARTLSCWFKLNTIEGNSNPALFGYGKRENGKFCGLFIESDGKVVFSGYNEQNHLYSPTGAVSVGKWYHVAAIKNGASEKLYINGVKVAEGTTGKNTELALGTIAYTSETTAHKLNGSLAACRIYERALSETEIVELAKEFTPESGGDDSGSGGYLVSGAGYEAVNGTYTATGNTINGYPQYSNGTFYLHKTNFENNWGLFDDPDVDSMGQVLYYCIPNDPDDPASGEWINENAAYPPPTVTKYHSSTDSGYLVTGSGAGDYVNGTYLPDGEKNGLPIYKCNNGAKMECLYTVMGGVQYEERRWEIYDSTGALAYYQNEVKGNMPDSGGWNRASAPDPVPTVTKV
jgi:hypothetical protein